MISQLAWMSRVECIDPQMVANFSTRSAKLDTRSRYHVKLETPHVCGNSLFTCRFLRGPLEEGNDIASFVHPDHHSLYNSPVSSFSCSLFLSQSRFSTASSSHFVKFQKQHYMVEASPPAARQGLDSACVGLRSAQFPMLACLRLLPSEHPLSLLHWEKLK